MQYHNAKTIFKGQISEGHFDRRNYISIFGSTKNQFEGKNNKEIY